MIDTGFLERCILTLETAWNLYQKTETSDIHHDLYRSACVKEFEIILEQSGKLLKKALVPWFHSSRAVDSLTFKDIFRHAGMHGLITIEMVERWYQYRNNRNSTAHDYGSGFANETVKLIEPFLADAKHLVTIIQKADV